MYIANNVYLLGDFAHFLYNKCNRKPVTNFIQLKQYKTCVHDEEMNSQKNMCTTIKLQEARTTADHALCKK